MDISHLSRTVGGFVKKNVVMVVAMVAALITCFLVPPDAAYLDYFDLKTLSCLFCVLAVVCALKNINFFYMLAKRIVRAFRNARLCVLALVYITFIGSMLIANDMALLTFLPLGLYVLTSTGKGKYMAFTFIMQNIAANLGGMLTPFGNPQNLYLYTKFEIPNDEFMTIMAPPFVLSVILITICCMIFVKPESLSLKDEPMDVPVGRTVIYLLLLLLGLLLYAFVLRRNLWGGELLWYTLAILLGIAYLLLTVMPPQGALFTPPLCVPTVAIPV